MSYASNSFDTIVIYNAIGHLKQVMEKTIDECLRVLRAEGSIYVVSSFKMDKQVICEHLLPFIEQKQLSYQFMKDKTFLGIHITR